MIIILKDIILKDNKCQYENAIQYCCFVLQEVHYFLFARSLYKVLLTLSTLTNIFSRRQCVCVCVCACVCVCVCACVRARALGGGGVGVGRCSINRYGSDVPLE